MTQPVIEFGDHGRQRALGTIDFSAQRADFRSETRLGPVEMTANFDAQGGQSRRFRGIGQLTLRAQLPRLPSIVVQHPVLPEGHINAVGMLMVPTRKLKSAGNASVRQFKKRKVPSKITAAPAKPAFMRMGWAPPRPQDPRSDCGVVFAPPAVIKSLRAFA
jgi:hypothetical protein